MTNLEFLLSETPSHLHGTIKELANKSPDSNVEKNREMLLQRSRLGLKKYGCTTEALSLRESLQHALEETLDLANYLQQAISEIDAKECGK